MEKETPKIILNLSIKKLYEDAISPSAKKIGLTLDKVITATAFNLANILERGSTVFSKNIIKYLEKFEKVDPSDIVQPSNEIAFNVLTRFKYIERSEIRDMFMNLLYSASHRDHINKAHPSFLRIIDSLSIDEARILKYLYHTNRTYLIFVSYNDLKTAESGILYKNGRAITCVEINEELLFPNMVDFYLDNLIQLGLLHSSVDLSITTKDVSYSIKDIKILKERLKQKEVDHKGLPDIISGGFGRTEFCELFMKACFTDD